MVLLIVASCAGDDSGGYISGARRRSQKEKELVSGIASTVYTVPAMDRVLVKVNAEFGEDRYMDIYYPPDYDFSAVLPAVIIYNGFSGLRVKNMGGQIDWAALVAAHGMIGITYDPVYAEKDFAILLETLVRKSRELGIDAGRLGLVSSCGNCSNGLREFRAKESEFYNGLNTGVFLYGTVPWTDDIRTGTSMLLVKTGSGLTNEIIESMDVFVQKAPEAGIKAELINYKEGNKNFDTTEQPCNPWEYGFNKKYTSDCDVMKNILGFLQQELM
jgi:hypothetical protein